MEDEVTLLRPQKGKQEMFLASPADIAVYGGAAGAGKSFALLLEAARHIDNPGYRGMILRKQFNQISSPGGLLDASRKVYPLLGAKFNKADSVWIFPSGASIKFAHLESYDEVEKYQGSEICFLGFDELTHFDQGAFWYMLSRNRSTCGVKPYMRATCNPKADSFVRDLLDWWIDPKTGLAIEARCGALRYFVRKNDTLFWADTPEELYKKFDLDTKNKQRQVKSFTFISARLQDNQILMTIDPGYLANLQALPLVEQERLLGGNWNIMPAAGMYFPRSKVNIINDLPTNVVKWVRAWDFAATEDRKNNDPADGPAYTAGVMLGKTREGRYVVADVVNERLNAGGVRKTVLVTAMVDKKKYRNPRIRLSQDPGQAGKDQAEQYIKMLTGFNVVAKRESGDKVTRAEPFSAQWIAGNVDVLNAPWTEAFLNQMDAFPEIKFKDMVDASSNAFNEIETAVTSLSITSETGSLGKTNGWHI